MDDFDGCRDELIEAVEVLDQLDSDFETLVKEVAALRYSKTSESYALTPTLNEMVKRRMIDLPYD